MKNYALITGASKGIGLELAKLFAKDGYSLVMVARSNDLLEKLKEEFTKEYGVDVYVLQKIYLILLLLKKFMMKLVNLV